MTFEQFSRYLILSMIVIMVLLYVVVLTMRWWMPAVDRIRNWYKNRNKRLQDYHDRHDFWGLIAPGVDGLIDWKYSLKVSRIADDRLEGRNMLFLPRLGLADNIENRYYNRAMKRVYKRASKIIAHYDKQAAYYEFDEELCRMIEEVKASSKHDCLICNDSKVVWGPASSCQTEVDCDCLKPKQAILV